MKNLITFAFLLISPILFGQTITTSNPSTPTATYFCQESTFNIAYTKTGTFTAGNIFRAQLSNSTGNFSSPTVIGSLTSTANGTISCTLPASLPAGTGYRIRVVSTTPVVTGSTNSNNITISDYPANPSTFGNNKWLVFCYNGQNLDTYRGNYEDTNLSFNTEDRWNKNSTPSNASAYIGCSVNNDNHSYAYKRQGFTCGNYTIAVASHDDDAVLYIDGNLVWSHIGWGDVHIDAWTGYLNAQSTVEFRVADGTGNSNGSLTFTQNSTDKGINKFITQTCGGGAQTIKITGISGTTWSPATGLNTTTGNTVIANPASSTTYTVTGTSNCDGAAYSDKVSVHTNPTNDFGLNEWKVFGYSDQNFTTYAGFYTETKTSFDTRNRWANTPSETNGYVGCAIGNDNHSYAHKREGFPCGNYTINITGHDDDIEIIVDGKSKFIHAGCCDAHSNIWTGFLGPNSKVEVRTKEGTGASYTAVDFIKNNSTPGLNTTRDYNCATNAHTLNVIGLSAVTWSPGTNLNTTTGNTVIATPTLATTYTASGLSLCDASPLTTTFNVVANPATEFPKNEWAVLCYDDRTFGAYRGFYTVPTLSFDTRNYWPQYSNPGLAPDYAGCSVSGDNHSYIHKREGFPCGTYQIDLVAHDDETTIYVDGKIVYTRNGWTNVAVSNIWTGFLGPNSQVEVRTGEGGGASNAAFTFTQLNSLAGNNSFQDFNCSTGEHTLKVVGLSAVTWTPTTGLNTSTGNTVLATPTVETQYVASGTSLCNASAMSLNFTVPASPSIGFGQNKWTVFCYNGRTFDTYRGFYTVSTTSFDTRDYWANNANPSQAANYLGCSVNGDNHSYIHKREGFPCGNYTINLTAHDDECFLYVDGVLKYSKNGTSGAVANVWTGFLGPNSKVEIQTGEGGGASYTAFSFVQNNSLAGINKIHDYDCVTGNNTLKVIGLSSITWTPTTGLNTATGTTVIATPAAGTIYTASGTSLCNGSPISTTFDVNVNPSVDYGNDAWSVFCFNGRNFDTYRGFYTVTTESFDTRNFWANNSNPSNASNYSGCSVNGDYHSYKHKRDGFPCGNYTINLVGHDDECFLYVDGVLKYSKVGTSGAVANVWTGFLGPNSQVEIQTGEGTGTSFTAFNFVQNNSLAGINKTQDYDCSTGINTLKVIGLSGVTWTPSTGLNTASGNAVLATPAALTTYTASGTSLCNGSPMSTQFEVNGNPDSDFGNNKWIVFAYNGQSFGTYRGSYTVSTASFDTRNAWASNSNPGNAANYLGCSVTGDDHSYKHKRAGFTCGNYQINLVAHDDNCTVIIDGVTVYNKATTTGAVTNIWTGFLGPNSQVEIRTGEGGGNSYTAFNFVYLNSGGPASGEKVWNGLADNNWFNNGNWCPSAPTLPTDNILISPNAPNYPVINTAGVSFNNIQFKNGAGFTVNNGISVDVRGNWNDEGAVAVANGTIRFVGTTAQTITGNNISFNNVEVNNTTGVTVNGKISITGLLTLTNGLVTTTDVNLITITETGSISTGASTRYINGPLAKRGNTNFIFPVGNATRYSPLEIQGITSSSTFKAQYFKTAYANTSTLNAGLNNVSGLEHWILDRTAGTGGAQVALYWDDAVKSGINDLADLQVARFNGTEWVTHGQTSTTGGTTGSGSILSNDVIPNFSPFTFGSLVNNNNPLPVELITFKGKHKSNTIVLEWATASEKDNDVFMIERSADGATFETIGDVKGSNNSSTLVNYSFTDDNITTGGFYYRLKQVDYDGEYEYSNIIFVSTATFNEVVKSKITIYPNPKNTSATLYVLLDNVEGNVTVEITNLKGGHIASQVYQITEGDDNVILTFTDEIPRGVYLVKAVGNSISQIARLVVE